MGDDLLNEDGYHVRRYAGLNEPMIQVHDRSGQFVQIPLRLLVRALARIVVGAGLPPPGFTAAEWKAVEEFAERVGEDEE